MLAAILGAFKAIPEIASVLRSLVDGIKDLVAAQKLAAQNEWLNKNRELITKVKHAKTDADRWAVLRLLQTHSQDFPDA